MVPETFSIYDYREPAYNSSGSSTFQNCHQAEILSRGWARPVHGRALDADRDQAGKDWESYPQNWKSSEKWWKGQVLRHFYRPKRSAVLLQLFSWDTCKQLCTDID